MAAPYFVFGFLASATFSSAGAGAFGIKWADGDARSDAIAATVGEGEAGFAAWLKIAATGALCAYWLRRQEACYVLVSATRTG